MEQQQTAVQEPTQPATIKPIRHSCFDIESILGKSLEEIDAIIANKKDHVRRIQIPKKDGSMRTILAPDQDLKMLQKKIYWKFLNRYRPHDCAHGFIRKRGIVSGAIQHVGANAIGKIDIKSFFDTINEKHLQNVLFGNKNICKFCQHYERMLDGQCNPSIYLNKTTKYRYRCEEMKAVFIPDYCARTGLDSLFKRIIEICTFDGFTAQGFPTSPILANIVLKGFDKRISTYCEENGITYTRYADDLAFSTKDKSVSELKSIMKTKVYRMLFAFGFKPNFEKTLWKSKAGRMKICGIVVNAIPNIQRRRYYNFKAQVHNSTVGKDKDTTTLKDIRKMKGFAAFIMNVNRIKGKRLMDKLCKFEHDKFCTLELYSTVEAA